MVQTDSVIVTAEERFLRAPVLPSDMSKIFVILALCSVLAAFA